MTWHERLLPASFRGVSFFVYAETRENTGRRTTTHEFAASEDFLREDLGKRAPALQVEGYLIGPDYDLARERLIAACEASGSGVLSLPIGGEVDVFCDTISITRTQAEGGFAAFSATFLPAGDAVEPRSLPNGLGQVGSAASGFLGDAQSVFVETIGGVEFGITTAETLASQIQGAVSVATSIASLISSGPTAVFDRIVGTVLNLGSSIFADPDNAAESLSVIARESIASGRTPDDRIRASVTAASRLFPSVPLTEIAASPIVDVVPALTRRSYLAEAAIASAESSPDSSNSAAEMRSEVTSVLDAEIEIAAATGRDLVWRQLRALRAEVVGDLTRRAATLEPLIEVAARTDEPLLVTAFRAYGDAVREVDLVRRNGIAHPGFVPPEARLLGLAS
ncbi:MAG: DNA circularization N-terminal domain-containing protein [Pseudomonadota bacterium]